MSKRKQTGRNQDRKPALNDWHLWTEVTRTVSPLRKVSAPPVEPASPPADSLHLSTKIRPAHEGGRLFRQQPAGSGTTWSPGATPAHHKKHIEHPNSGIEPKMRRRVRRGQLPIDARIDLHGLRQPEAHAALYHFIKSCAARGDRTLLVITGKGLKKTEPEIVFERGVLRHMLPIWLNEPGLAPMISGYEISAQHHGGEGAYYVRLKRSI